MKQDLITLDKNRLNRLQDIAYLLQVCLNEFQKEINHFSVSLKNENSNRETIQNYENSSSEPLSTMISSFKELLDTFVEGELKEDTTNCDKQKNAISVTFDSQKDSEQFSNNFDKQENEIDEITLFFRKERKLFHSIYFKEEFGKIQTYYITLQNDNTENREIIFEFFDIYETKTQLSFFIQFVPLKLVDKFSHFNKLDIN